MLSSLLFTYYVNLGFLTDSKKVPIIVSCSALMTVCEVVWWLASAEYGKAYVDDSSTSILEYEIAFLSYLFHLLIIKR